MPYTYIVRCADGSYDVGSTWDVEARVWQHNSPDLGAAYTRHRQPVTLVWSCWFDSIEQAFSYEKRIRGWGRRKREALIRGEYGALPDLSRRAGVQRRAADGDGVSRLGASAPRTSTTSGGAAGFLAGLGQVL